MQSAAERVLVVREARLASGRQRGAHFPRIHERDELGESVPIGM